MTVIDSLELLYKWHAMDTVKSLDDIAKRKSLTRDLFSSETIFYRNRLKDYCERLMFHDPTEYGRKVEELLWRKVFYEPIQFMKQFKKNTRLPKNVTTSYQTHLMAASGFYNHLLFKLQYEFKLNLEFVTDCYYRRYSSAAEFDMDTTKYNEKGVSWAEKAVHRCLLYLGDLARYMKEHDGNKSWVVAQRYYYQALHYLPENGMPHNQLGTLVGTRYYGLDAAYHYIRCMASSSKFQGASANLRRVFDQNQKRYRELSITQSSSSNHKELSPRQQRTQDIKSFSIKFLHLMDILYNLGPASSTSSVEPKELQSLCQTVLKEFDFVLFHPPPEDNYSSVKLGEEKMAYLEDEMVFKIVVLITIVIHKLQYQGSKQVAAAIALNLAVFSHILNHTLTRLQTTFYEARNPTFPTKHETDEVLGAAENVSANSTGLAQLSDDELDKKIRSKLLEEERREISDEEDDDRNEEAERRLARMKRRRRRRTDEDLSEGEDELHHEEALTMISDDEEELNFLTGAVDSSSSSEEDDNLAMVSQELRPGFLDSAASTDVFSNYATSSGSISLHNLLSSNLSNDFVGNADDLQQISSDLLSITVRGIPQPPYSYNYSAVDDIAQGKKQVSVPPGFDKDPEVRHVDEIGRKLATFTIDTDTNSSIHTGSDQSDTETESMIDRNESREKQFQHVLTALANQGLLCVIKVLCDWLICQPQIINTCIQSSPMLWSRLSYFLNFLPLETMITKPGLYRSSELLSHIENLKNGDRPWRQVFPMREDINMYKLPVMSEAHSLISFDREIQLDNMEEALLRICCLRNFGYRMAHLTGSSFTYNKQTSMFFGPQLDSSNQDQDAQVKMVTLYLDSSNDLVRFQGHIYHAYQINNKLLVMQEQFKYSKTTGDDSGGRLIITLRTLSQSIVDILSKALIAFGDSSLEDMDAKRNQLMKDMAQLRLQAEVSQLKDSVHSNMNRNLPPYLVPDASALLDTMHLIKQLVHGSKFIIIIPLCVIDQLDSMKKDSGNARDAIRWLEAEFRNGNKYIRVQKHHERSSSNSQKNLRRKDKELWRMLQIIDCCQYLSKQTPECHPSGMVSVLTNENFTTQASAQVKQKIQQIQQQGLVIHKVTEFYAKWKEQWKKKG